MIFLYTVLLLLVGVCKFLVERRAMGLAWKYTKVSCAVTKLVGQNLYREGNSGRLDSCQAAKRQFELGRLAQERDRLEARHFIWQNLADKLTGLLNAIRGWKGRKLPYTLGAVDVWLVMYAIDHLGTAEFLSLRNLVEIAGQMLAQ